MLLKRCQRRSKGRPKNVLKMLIVFSSIFTVLGLPKGGPKVGSQLPFEVPFRVLGAIWLQKASPMPSERNFTRILTILQSFFQKNVLMFAIVL